MKTTTPEVLCDSCNAVIPVMHPTAIFATLRGPTIGHKKLDCCDVACLATWATKTFDRFGPAGVKVIDLMQALKDSLARE